MRYFNHDFLLSLHHVRNTSAALLIALEVVVLQGGGAVFAGFVSKLDWCFNWCLDRSYWSSSQSGTTDMMQANKVLGNKIEILKKSAKESD